MSAGALGGPRRRMPWSWNYRHLGGIGARLGEGRGSSSLPGHLSSLCLIFLCISEIPALGKLMQEDPNYNPASAS